MVIAYSFGMVDLIHFGHINVLKKAKEETDMHIFGLVSDEACDDWYGVHVSNESERLEVLKSIKYIDEIMIQKDFDPLDNLKLIHEKYPDATIVLFYGSEWSVLSSKSYLESIGGHTKRIDYYGKLSPQHILDTLSSKVDNNKKPTSGIISTKANTLLALKGMLTKSTIEDILIISIKEYWESKEAIVKKIQTTFKKSNIVIRSSSKREDAFEESNAGHFTSVIGVDSSNPSEVKKSIEKVISSYVDCEDIGSEQVLIQRQTSNVLVSGVIFTRDIQHNRPYYVINYDTNGSTDSVTSGLSGKTLWISNDANRESVPPKWLKLMESIWELQEALPGILLDVEFAITKESIVIFQVRPLAAAYKYGRNNNDKEINWSRMHCMDKYNRCSNDGLTMFSDMSFWNPAEIIGDNPKNLDYSLYRTIITKSAWNKGLVPMGYRKVPSELMFRFGNKPYINLEKSFLSLMPKSISPDFANRLKTFYIERLKFNPSSHDKIEFEISHNCFDFSLRDRLELLTKSGFAKKDISFLEESLAKLTINCVKNYKIVLKQDLLDLNRLDRIRNDIEKKFRFDANHRSLAKSIRLLMDSIERFGTPQFSRHARCAFIAKAISKSLVDKKYISSETYHIFLTTIETVATEYDADYHKVLAGKMSQSLFMSKYGHLRSGTYNINSLRYDQVADLFSCQDFKDRFNECEMSSKVSSEKEMKKALDKALMDYKISNLNANELLWFIKESTKQREFFKFIFTKSLSLVIEIIKRLGELTSIETDKLAYLEIPEIYSAEHYSSINRLKEFWELIINRRQDLFRINSNLILPSLIKGASDFDVIETIDSRANFITNKKVTGEVCFLTENSKMIDVSNRIVVIEKADPGFDWIFSKGILGLLTKYGGAASHMAIRCAEFKVAAAIGCGTTLFEYACDSHVLTVDCEQEKIVRER